MLKKTKMVPLKNFIARKGLFSHEDMFPEELKHIQSEVHLGRKIIDRAILDSVDCSSTKNWFDILNEDFNTICFIAHLDPIVVVEDFIRTHERLLNNEYIQVIYKEYDEEDYDYGY
jgi:hypothetical protein